MSTYLQKLKQYEKEKKITNSPDPVLTKPTKPPFVSLVGSDQGTNVNIFSQEIELRRLVKLVSDFHNFTKSEYEEALEIALNDRDEALVCFRSLARWFNLLEK